MKAASNEKRDRGGGGESRPTKRSPNRNFGLSLFLPLGFLHRCQLRSVCVPPPLHHGGISGDLGDSISWPRSSLGGLNPGHETDAERQEAGL